MNAGALSQFYHALWLSLVVSGLATVVGALIGIPLGAILSEFRFRGRGAILTVVHTFMGLPPVVVGVYTFFVIMRAGPLGSLGLYYSATAMVLVQAILATPIIAGLSHASLAEIDPRLGIQARSLGATRPQEIRLKVHEARPGVVAAVIAGFGRVIAEVGAVTIVGGSISYRTDTLTTLTVKFTRIGNYWLAFLAGTILLLIALVVNVFLTHLQSDRGQRELERRVTGYVD